MKKYKNEAWLRSKIEVENQTQKSIADLCNVSVGTISYFARKFNIERADNTRSKVNLENAEKLQDKDWLHNEYINLNKSYDTIAAEYKLGKTTIARWVKRHGLHKLKDVTQSGKRKGEGPRVESNCAECGEGISVKYCRVIENPTRFCGNRCASTYTAKHTDIIERLREGLVEWQKTPEAKIFMREHGARTYANQDAKETGIERKIRELLTREGIRFEDQKKMYYWCVDFYLPEYDIVIEAQGDYWHAHPDIYSEPNAMQKKNIRRDKGKAAYLPKCGHTFLAFWETDINNDIEGVLAEIRTAIYLKEAIA